MRSNINDPFSSPKGTAAQRLIRGVAVTTVGNLLLKGTRFFLVPLYARYLTPQDYGIVGVLMPLIAVMAIFKKLGLNAGLAFYMFEERQQQERFRTTVSTAAWLEVIASVTLAGVFILAGPEILIAVTGNAQGLPSEFLVPLIMLIVLGVPQSIVMTLFQAREKRQLIAGVSFISFFVLFALMWFQLVVKGSGALGQISASALHLAVFAVPFALYLGSVVRWKMRFSWASARRLLVFSLPLLPHALMMWGLNLSDRIFVAHFSGLEAAGYYTFAYTCGMVMMAVTHATQSVWGPVFFDLSQRGSANSKALGSLASHWILALGSLAAVGIAFSPELVRLIATERYWPAVPYVAPVILGYFFLAVYTFPALVLQQRRMTGRVSLGTAVAFALNLGMNVLLIPRFGPIAAAWATAVAFATMSLIYFSLAGWGETLPLRWREIGTALALIVAAFGLAQLEPGVQASLAKLLLIVLIGSVLVIAAGGPVVFARKLRGITVGVKP